MVLVKDGEIRTEDPWIFLDDDAASPAYGLVAASLSRWRAHPRAYQGLVLQPADDAATLTPEELAAIEMVAITFPAYKDGRGFTQARILRERFNYKGEIRAVGDVLYDQLSYMQRVGFSAFEVRKAADAEDFEKAVNEFSAAYQVTPQGHRPAAQIRHR